MASETGLPSLFQNRAEGGRPYHFPPGLQNNLIWYAFRKFRPGEPIGLFQYLVREFGDVVHYKIGPEHILFINDPAYIREILVVQNDNFTKERTVRRTRMLLGDGMITSEGDQHRGQRQVAQPAFHRQRIQRYAATMVEESLWTRDSWRDHQEVDLAQEMMSLTLRIVARTLFSTELGSEVQELVNAINQIMRLYNYLVALPAVEILIHLRMPGLSRFTAAKRRVDAIVHRMIENHRHRDHRNGDLLDMMLEAPNPADDDALRDQVITIFLAGYETVANALIWTWYLLSQNPAAGEIMFQEIQAVTGNRPPSLEDVPRLRYTEAVFAESMRIYPPAWAMGRQARKDFALGPYYLPAGTTVLISQFVTHRDPQNFEGPLEFRPERFTSGRATFPKFTYFPFGAGARQCIGEAFAWTEGVLALASIAQKWKLHLVEGQSIKPQALITLRSKYGLRMRPVSRH
ncbi:MAG TPA: cytochrome P450 [Terriglobales bacterium]|nr:cytochrome P450 [Terriglobales bacterium]